MEIVHTCLLHPTSFIGSCARCSFTTSNIIDCHRLFKPCKSGAVCLVELSWLSLVITMAPCSSYEQTKLRQSPPLVRFTVTRETPFSAIELLTGQPSKI